MKKAKKWLALFLAGAMMLSAFVGCGNKDNQNDANNNTPSTGDETPGTSEDNKVEVKQHKIGIAHYTDSGKGVEALKAYLAGISEATGCEFVYATLHIHIFYLII